MMRQKLKNDNGFTFVELIIAVAILAVIMVSISSFMASTSAVYTRTTKDNDIQMQAQDVYNLASDLIMQAQTVMLIAEDTSGDTSVFVSDDRPNISAYDTDNGFLVNTRNYKAKINVPIQNDSFGIDGTYAKAFKFLKDSSPYGNTFTNVKIKALYIGYQTKSSGGTYRDCYATFVMGADKKLYLNRHYSDDSDGATYAGAFDLGMESSNLLCEAVMQFDACVDADENSIGLTLKFNNNVMSYNTLGMTKIRNTSVLTRR